MTSRRVVIALGGNAMTGPDGSATPGAQRDAIARACRPHRRRRRRRRRGGAHPRQRPAGGQPAGEERAGRARRAAGAAGLVRRPDPGDDRASPSPTSWTPRSPRAGCRSAPPGWSPARWSTPTTRASRAVQAGRPVPPREEARAVHRARPDLGGPRRAGLAPRGRLARAACRWSTPRPSTRWPPPASSSSAPAGAASRWWTTGRTGSAARRRGRHRQGPDRGDARPRARTPTPWSSPPTSRTSWSTSARRRSGRSAG